LRGETRAPRTYELMTIIHPDVTEEELPGEIETISGYISTNGGEISDTLRESPWGRRRLAYPIRHGGRDLRDGFYVVCHFDAAPDQLTELERELKLNERVIRYLLTNYEAQPIDPRVIEQQEIDAEDAAAAAYVAAQAAAVAAAQPEVAEAVEVAEVVEAVEAAEVAEIVEAVEVAEAVAIIEVVEAAEVVEAVEIAEVIAVVEAVEVAEEIEAAEAVAEAEAIVEQAAEESSETESSEE
jgi:small subunit ribosomal protein S6